ncbi:hypothetical protein K2P47_02505 [Patescibacteria group bacterium]|nr:hypothetical protein [Patescibacteria group bacterium]
MPKRKAFGKDEAIIAFVSGQIRKTQATFGVTVAEMARVAGYERSVFHRVLRGDSICNIEALHRLSVHYNLPMDYWFPPREGIAAPLLPVPQVVPVQDNAIPTMLPFTRKMIRQMNIMSVSDKRILLVLALKHAQQLQGLVLLAKALEQVNPETKKKIVMAVQKLAAVKKQPVP